MRTATIRLLLLLFVSVAGTAQTSGHPRDLVVSSDRANIGSDVEFQRDLSELDSLRQSGDLDSLERTINRDSLKWMRRDQKQFVQYMFKSCSTLSSYDIGNISKRASLLSRYAILVLEGEDLTLEENAQFAEFLVFDPPEIDQQVWKTLREQKARLLLAAWHRVAGSIDPTFDFADRPFLNVAAPPASGMPAGVDPEAITDPKLRAEYERAIVENAAQIRRSNKQIHLKQTAPRFFAEVQRYLVSAYSRSPMNLPELDGLLTEYLCDPVVHKRVLDEVRKSQR